jgi:hypothetical protein
VLVAVGNPRVSTGNQAQSVFDGPFTVQVAAYDAPRLSERHAAHGTPLQCLRIADFKNQFHGKYLLLSFAAVDRRRVTQRAILVVTELEMAAAAAG